MRMLAIAPAAAIAIAGAAYAADEAQLYDRRLAQAAAEIVASRMGSLRGAFEVDENAEQLVTVDPAANAGPADATLTARARRPRTSSPPRPGVWQNGLAIAVERKSTVSPEL